MLKPTQMEVEAIFDAACQYLTDLARENELDAMRHDACASLPAAHTGMIERTRANLRNDAKAAAKRNTRLAEISRQMREHCHEKNLSDLFSSLEGKLL